MTTAATWIHRVIQVLTLPGRPPDQYGTVTAVDLVPPEAQHEYDSVLTDSPAESRIKRFVSLYEKLGDERAYWAYIYQPADVARLVYADRRDAQSWATLVELYEAHFRLASQRALGEPTRANRTAVAYLARTRWRLLALPYPPDSALYPPCQQRLGQPDANATRAREARADWSEILDRIDDLPLLARDVDQEAEADHLTRIAVDARQDPIARRQPLPIDAEVWRRYVRYHLLPRFAVTTPWRVASQLAPPWARRLNLLAALLLTLAICGLALGTSRLWPWLGPVPSNIAALLGYATIAIVAAGERAAGWPWWLRQPAGAALGAFVLATVHPDWWQGHAPDERQSAIAAAATITAAAAGYLFIEAVNHGVRGPRLRRVPVVALMGFGHATLVSAIALTWILPTFAEGGEELACWQSASCEAHGLPAWLMLLLAASWSFAAGVFSQILWDQQPITAPLAHLGWSRRDNP